jgi:transcriptional regulator with XRE-family HTH domain
VAAPDPKKHVVPVEKVLGADVALKFPNATPATPWFRWIVEALDFRNMSPKDLPEIMLPYVWSNTSAKEMCRGVKKSKSEGGKVRMTEQEVAHLMIALDVPDALIPPPGYFPTVPNDNPQAKLRLPQTVPAPEPAQPVVLEDAIVTPLVEEEVKAPTPLTKLQAVSAPKIAQAQAYLDAYVDGPAHELLRAKRESLDLRQGQLATMLGISQTALCRAEQGLVPVTDEVAAKWVDLLGVTLVTPLPCRKVIAGVSTLTVFPNPNPTISVPSFEGAATPEPEVFVEPEVDDEPATEVPTLRTLTLEIIDMAKIATDAPTTRAATDAPTTRAAAIAEMTRVLNIDRLKDEEVIAIVLRAKEDARNVLRALTSLV